MYGVKTPAPHLAREHGDASDRSRPCAFPHFLPMLHPST